MISPKGTSDPQLYFQTKITQIQESTLVSASIALLLYKKFGSVEIINDQWQQNSEEILKSLHINLDSNNVHNNLEMKNVGQGECPLCFKNTELYQLYCGHIICKNCLVEEIMYHLDTNLVPVCRGQCQDGTLCNAEILKQDIINLFSNSLNAIKTYNRININDLIQKDPNARSCPQCNSIITSENKIGNHYGCCTNCGSFICFKCHDSFHGPLECDRMKDFLETQKQTMDQLEEDQNSWFFREKRCQQYRNSHRDQFERYFNDLIEKAKKISQKEVDKINQEKSLYNNIVSSSDFDFHLDHYKRFIFSEAYKNLNFAFNDEETINVITTKCPKCKEYVERNGGCNHMQCRCGCQFCFSCGQVWDSSHSSYKCPKYASRTETRSGQSHCGIDFNNTSDQNFYPPPMDQEKRKLFVSYKNLRILYQQCKEKYNNLEKELMSSDSDSPKNKLIKIFMQKNDEKSSSNFANKIINTALVGQKFVMYGYPEMFYIMTKRNDTKDFDSHLNMLEKEVENLVKNIKCSSNCDMNFYQQLIENIHGQIKYIINISEQY